MKPLMLVITGLPGAGKTTLSERLSREWCLPLISRDRIKEGYIHTMGMPGDQLLGSGNSETNTAFFDVLSLLLDHGISCIAEAAFQHKLWSMYLPPFLEKADVRLLICQLDPHLALNRFLDRGMSDPGRLYFHGDKGVRLLQSGVKPEPGTWDEPRMGIPTFHINTADGYDPPLNEMKKLVFLGRK